MCFLAQPRIQMLGIGLERIKAWSYTETYKITTKRKKNNIISSLLKNEKSNKKQTNQVSQGCHVIVTPSAAGP